MIFGIKIPRGEAGLGLCGGYPDDGDRKAKEEKGDDNEDDEREVFVLAGAVGADVVSDAEEHGEQEPDGIIEQSEAGQCTDYLCGR